MKGAQLVFTAINCLSRFRKSARVRTCHLPSLVPHLHVEMVDIRRTWDGMVFVRRVGVHWVQSKLVIWVRCSRMGIRRQQNTFDTRRHPLDMRASK